MEGDYVKTGPQDIGWEDVDERFTSVPGHEAEHEVLTHNFRSFGRSLARALPAGRKKSEAFAALEVASFHAHAAIARQKG